MRPFRAALAALALTACATPPSSVPVSGGPSAGGAGTPGGLPPGGPETGAVSPFAALLRGWEQEDHAAALAAFRQTCPISRDEAVRTVCSRAQAIGPLDGPGARRFLESNFRPQRVGGGPDLLTGYYSPEYEARERREGPFSAPVRPRPADLKSPGPAGVPYVARAEIDRRPTTDALAWMRPEDLFFLQIQGSGVLLFPGGRRMRAAFAAHNGQEFLGIARPMRERGLLADNQTSGAQIRDWLAAHRGPQADEVMRLNPRYVFFTLAPDDGRGPVGAATVPLPAGRAVAVDPAFHAYGSLYWLDAEAPVLSGAFPTYRRLVVALDTGGAIKGAARADLYVGQGEASGVEAGRIRHQLAMYRLVPVEPGP